MRTSENSVQAKFEVHPFHAITRYSAVYAAHPQGDELPGILYTRSSQNFVFHVLGCIRTVATYPPALVVPWAAPSEKRSCPVNQLLKLLSTAAAGALDVWVGIITGLALGLSPPLSGAVSIASALAGVTLVVAVGGRLRHLIYRSRRLAKRRERIESVWKRYGIPGVALQAPLLTGPLLATLLALALGAPPRPLLLWMLASVVLWGLVLTGAAALGFSMFGL